MDALADRYNNELHETYMRLRNVIDKKKAERAKVADLAAKLEEAEKAKAEAINQADTQARMLEEVAREMADMKAAAEARQVEKLQLEEDNARLVDELRKEQESSVRSRTLWVTRERFKTREAMAAKADAHFKRLREREEKLDKYDDARCVWSQAHGTWKCLELMKDEGENIPQAKIEFYKRTAEVKKAAAQAADPGSPVEGDYVLSPLVLESEHVDETLVKWMEAGYDTPYVPEDSLPNGEGEDEEGAEDEGREPAGQTSSTRASQAHADEDPASQTGEDEDPAVSKD